MPPTREPMPPTRNHPARASFWPQPPSEQRTLQSRLDLLRNWRKGSAATAIVMAALLPSAVAWQANDLVAIASSLVVAMTLAVSCHVVHKRRLAALAIFPEFARLPELAGTRIRLVTTRNRRAVATGLRRAASPSQPPRRFDCCPVLVDRVADVHLELLRLADTLEQTQDPDPASIALIRELLTNACSPLYNPNLPDTDLHAVLTRADAGLAPSQPQGLDPLSQPRSTPCAP
jgi:hypothetical protein